MRNLFYAAVAACAVLVMAGALDRAASQPASPSLDYEFFKTRVEPIFLTKRPGHTRCGVCHTVNNAPFHLVPLSPGSAGWNDEQSRQNFQLIQRVATAGELDSPLLRHPLAKQAGGDGRNHRGGPQFTSQNDPLWLTLKAFVQGQKG